MAESAWTRHQESGYRIRGVPLLDAVAAAGMLGALFGLIDFFLFETHSQRPVIHEFVLSKPSFWSLSLLSYQVVILTLFATFLCLFSFLAIKSVSKRFVSLKLFSPLAFSVFSVFFLLIMLRLLRNSGQYFNLILLTIWFLISILLVFLLERKALRKSIDPDYRHSNRMLISSFVITVFIISCSFLAPDIQSAISRISSRTEIQDSKSPNILFIVLDTVRTDHLSCYGYKQNETPNIDRISRDSLLFLNAFSTAPWTVPSHASMFTGLHTFQHHADWGHTYLTSDHLTIAEYLKEMGYRTAGFSENPFVGPHSGLAQGFTEFHESWRRPIIVRAIKKLMISLGVQKDQLEYAGRTSGLFRRWLIAGGENRRPFFAYINFMAAHLPRYPRRSFGDGRWSSETLKKIEPVNLVPERFYLEPYRLDQHELSVMREIYDQEISYMDEYIGEIVDFLNERKILENTILIITSDHGENFGEHGFVEHQLCIYNTLIHVPLLIRYPRLFSPRIIDENVSTINIFSTIVEILNAERDEMESPRTELDVPSLQRTSENQMIISEYANGLDMMKRALRSEAQDFDFSPFDRELKSLIIGGHKYICDSTGREELYDIRADPGEKNDIAAQESSMVLHFRQMLTEFVDSGEKPLFAECVRPIDDATRDALRALGYEP